MFAYWLPLALGLASLVASAAVWWVVAFRLREGVLAAMTAHREELQAAAQKARVDLAQLGEQVEQMIEEARSQRHKAAGAKGGRGNHAQPGPTFASVQAYRRHLERGGARDIDAERGFGWV